MAARAGRYIIWIGLEGLLPREGASMASSAPAQTRAKMALPVSPQWRCVITVRQPSVDNSVHTISHSVPLSSMMHAQTATTTSNGTYGAVDRRVLEMAPEVLASTEVIHMDVALVFPFAGGAEVCRSRRQLAGDAAAPAIAGTLGGATSTTRDTHHTHQHKRRRLSSADPEMAALASSMAVPTQKAEGMSIHVGRFFFDMLDFSVPAPTVPLGLPFSLTNPPSTRAQGGARRSDTGVSGGMPGTVKTMDEVMAEVRRHAILKPNAAAPCPISSTLSSPAEIEAPALVTVSEDITWMIHGTTPNGDGDATIGDRAGNQETTVSATSPEENAGAGNEGRILSTLLGVPQRWRWERGRPGVVSAYGVLWGGHRVSITARIMQGHGTQDSQPRWRLQVQATCSDASRLAMLRACLHQRLATVARAPFADGSAESSTIATAAGVAGESRAGKRLSMAADSSLRDVERQLLNAKLHVAQLLEELGRQTATPHVDASAKTKQVAALYGKVSDAYRIIRLHTP